MSAGGSKPVDAGTWYYVAYHHGLGLGPIDAFLEFDAGPKIAWTGELTASGAITVNKPGLLGGEKDQGGLVGTLRVMFGEADQERNAYLVSVFGPQTVPWRGFATVAWEGGKYGANNPYPQRASYMIRKIKKGWDNDACWYEEKAEIPVADGLALFADAGGWSYQVTAEEADPGNTNLAVPVSGWSTGGQAPFGNDQSTLPVNTAWPEWTTLWLKRTIVVPTGRSQTLRVQVENGCVVFINGVDVGAINRSNAQIEDTPTFEFPLVGGQTYQLAIKAFDEPGHEPTSATYLSASSVLPGLTAMNPAHILYFLRTSQDRGREPTENMADDNLRAAADQFHLEGFGLCGTRKAATVSAADYERHICEITDSSFSRSVVDGKWYIDRANGDYDLDSLPILTDDDILSFDETPTVLDNAINSVSVKYFDVLQNRVRTTPAVRALGLIATFGENHQTYDFQEIPNWDMACKVALRKLVAAITPTRGFKLATTPVTRGWRRFQYFRLQSPKRGIADMVCLVGGIEHGKLKSGGINLTAAQDTFSIQDTAYVQYEPGVDTRPDGTASPITQQRAFEAPYFQVLTSMSRAEFAALPEDVGYLVGVAADPASSRDFTMTVAPDGGEYVAVRDGPFCPTATVIEEAYAMDTAFTLSGGARLEDVVVGSAVLWGDEICRVDAIDPAAMPPTITLGRGCADTTPAPFHAAGSRLFFYDDAAAGDSTEYTDGETVNVKLLTNTSSEQLDPDGATAMDVTFAQRLLRPYPPGQLRLNGDAYPAEVVGDLSVTFVPRDRVLQADQLVDAEMAGIGPEAGTTYGVELYDTGDDSLLYSEDGIVATPALIPESNLAAGTRIEVYAQRDDLQSFQRCTHTFTYDGSPAAIASSLLGKLRHWWPLDEASTENAAHDLHGGQALVIKGATQGAATLRSGGSASMFFDSTDAATRVNGVLPLFQKIGSVEVASWVQPDDVTSAARRSIIGGTSDSDVSSTGNVLLTTYLNTSGVPAIGWEYATGTDEVHEITGSGVPLAADTPAFLSEVRNISTGTVATWKDGSLVGSEAYTNLPTGGGAASNGFAIGNETGGGTPLNGGAQDVALFEGVLSTAERSYLFNAGAGRAYADLLSDASVTKPSNSTVAGDYASATEFVEPWSSLSGWTSTGVQVSGNKLYGVSGANPSAATKAFAVAAGASARVVARIYNDASTPKTAYIGFQFGGVAAPAVNSPNFIGVGVQGTSSGRAGSYVGANFASSTGQAALTDSPILTTGFYDAIVSMDATTISLVLRRDSDGMEWSLSVPRSNAPNSGAVSYVVAYNGDSRGVNAVATHIQPLGAKKSLTGLRLKTAGGVNIEGERRRVIHPGNGWRVQVPRGYTGKVAHPLVLFCHQASTGNRNSVWSESRMLPVTNALEAAGYMLASADDSGDRWGNQASLDNYAALVEYIQTNYNVSYVALLAPSMGGLSALNLIATEALTNVRAMAGIAPVCDLAKMYADAAWTSAIETAYSFSGSANYAAATDGYDPMLADAALFATVPIRIWASSSDTVVPEADHADAFAAKLAGVNPDISIVACTGAHLAADQYRAAEVVAFLDGYMR